MGHKVEELLLIIPASVDQKELSININDLNGYPLIYYTVKVAKKLKALGIVNEIVISTDCIKSSILRARAKLMN